ncbi:MAG: hypothetical protein HY681_09340 [Chloroflexi bacterium]|nr:hypothetical protein [Chloroflexota bacterium]
MEEQAVMEESGATPTEEVNKVNNGDEAHDSGVAGSPAPGEASGAMPLADAGELAVLRIVLAQRDAELAGLRADIAAAAARYREALLAAAPEVPPDLVAGASIEDLDASLAKARQVVERIRSQGQAQQPAPRIPGGSPVRSAPDLSSLSPREKIAYALGQRGTATA